jgi:hypothetical protein
MSYSFGIAPCHAEDLRERVEEAAAKAKESAGDHWVEEADDDIKAAVDAAVRLAQSLAEGDGAVKVTASISGHANAGREPPPGWSSDSVYVSVARVAETPASSTS